jgi:hypothetical protein
MVHVFDSFIFSGFNYDSADWMEQIPYWETPHEFHGSCPRDTIFPGSVGRLYFLSLFVPTYYTMSKRRDTTCSNEQIDIDIELRSDSILLREMALKCGNVGSRAFQ